MLEVNIVTVTIEELKHLYLMSQTWLQLPLTQNEAGITSRQQLKSERKSTSH